ncbi:MAG TPA: DUF374 domain-containing protein [Spirochaetota bacterium]|nr:DUF374 domain-containing protein [Spirochaetota bacterium]
MYRKTVLFLYGLLGKILIKTIYRTCKKKVIGETDFHGAIIGMYHGQFFPLPVWYCDYGYQMHENKRITIMVSLHKDGAILNSIIKRFGGDTVRGDSRKQSVFAMRSILKKIKKGFTTVFAMDGPVGPYKSIQPGIIVAALYTGKPIRLMFTRSLHACVFKKAWDKFYIPRPFSTICIYIANAWHPDPDIELAENIKNLKEYAAEEEAKLSRYCQ